MLTKSSLKMLRKASEVPVALRQKAFTQTNNQDTRFLKPAMAKVVW